MAVVEDTARLQFKLVSETRIDARMPAKAVKVVDNLSHRHDGDPVFAWLKAGVRVEDVQFADVFVTAGKPLDHFVEREDSGKAGRSERVYGESVSIVGAVHVLTQRYLSW